MEEHLRIMKDSDSVILARVPGPHGTSAGVVGCPNALEEARRLFAAHRELRSLPAGRNWRRAVLKQEIEAGLRRTGLSPLEGDALFFRSCVLADGSPEQAIGDLRKWLGQPDSVETDRRRGGGRLIVVGDLLLKLGQFDDAAYAYRLIDDPSQAIRDRLAVALVCAEVIRGSGPEALARAAVAGCQLAPASPWPPLLAALGFVIALQGDDAIAHVEAAERRGASEAACRSLRAVCDALGKAAVAQEGDPTARGLATTGAEVVLRLLCGPGATPDRLQDFIRATGEGWIDLCPTDPEPTARLLLAAWCDEGNWDKAVSFADRLVQSGCPWAARLATLVRLRGPGASRARRNGGGGTLTATPGGNSPSANPGMMIAETRWKSSSIIA